MSAARLAVYWAPEEDDPLWAAGCRWLGRDPTQVPHSPAPADRGEPWRYGFHATLKAPMALAKNHVPDDLFNAMQHLAAGHAPFELPQLQVGLLDGFIALLPTAPCAPLQALADDCVTRLDTLRRPLDPNDEARRRVGLDDAQTERLRRWGYPHVLAGWRFHLTLSDRLPDNAQRAALVQAARQHFQLALAEPRRVLSLAVFEQPGPGQPFLLRRRVALGRGPESMPR